MSLVAISELQTVVALVTCCSFWLPVGAQMRWCREHTVGGMGGREGIGECLGRGQGKAGGGTKELALATLACARILSSPLPSP